MAKATGEDVMVQVLQAVGELRHSVEELARRTDQRFEQMDRRFEVLLAHAERAEQRFENLERGLVRVTRMVSHLTDELRENHANHERRLVALERQRA